MEFRAPFLPQETSPKTKKQAGRQAKPQKHKPSEVEGMGDTWKLYRSLVLSGTISTGMCQSGRVLLTAHGDSASGQQKPQVRALCFLSLQDTQHPLPHSPLQQATQKHAVSQTQEREPPPALTCMVPARPGPSHLE